MPSVAILREGVMTEPHMIGPPIHKSGPLEKVQSLSKEIFDA